MPEPAPVTGKGREIGADRGAKRILKMAHTRTRIKGLAILDAHLYGFFAMFRESWRSLIETVYSTVAIVLFLYLAIFHLSTASGGGWALDLLVVYCEALLWPVFLLSGPFISG